MVTNKSSSIRLGSGRNWFIKGANLAWTENLLNLKTASFLETLFSDEFFRSRGVTYSSSVLKMGAGSITLNIFIQDSKILDFYNSIPRRALFSRKIVRRRHRRFRTIYSSRRRGCRYFVSRKALFIKPRRFFGFMSETRAFLKLYNKKFLSNFRLTHRRKLRRRKNKFKPTRFYNQFFYTRYYSRAIRARFYTFFSRFFASVFQQFFGYKVKIKFSFFPSRHATAKFYLNYVTTKLYYRYILSDLVNPIVRLSIKNYRGFAINCKGRFTRAQIAVQKYYRRGSLGFSTLSVPIDYAQKSVVLKYGTCNLKIWIRH